MVNSAFRIFSIILFCLFLCFCQKGKNSSSIPVGEYKWSKSNIVLSNNQTLTLTPNDISINYYITTSRKNDVEYYQFFENEKLLFKGKIKEHLTTSNLSGSSYNYKVVVFIKGQKFITDYYSNQNYFIIDKFPFTATSPDNPIFTENYILVNSNISTSDILLVQNYFEEI